ncbi:hypothetical protein OGAPHI_006116 [Ogataea philodendri]|uniref:Uncharacterized protein n=1 Tax=Ogataea philodendri TaxID=1378263 RepID=A0A9P8NYK1_9ASCO|nr:uncharacterized protein OGAPHI_006116 [Ogataea philodendri]KAH3661937.1 hypothetical protein OGAPHI_006116 [Ogataea philodendri]
MVGRELPFDVWRRQRGVSKQQSSEIHQEIDQNLGVRGKGVCQQDIVVSEGNVDVSHADPLDGLDKTSSLDGLGPKRPNQHRYRLHYGN